MISILRTSSSAIFALPLPTPNAASAMSTSLACGASSSASLSMFTTTCRTLGFASSAWRRVTTITLLHSGLSTSRCRMCRPTLPVAPSNIAVYSTVVDVGIRSRVSQKPGVAVKWMKVRYHAGHRRCIEGNVG